MLVVNLYKYLTVGYYFIIFVLDVIAANIVDFKLLAMSF
jgi:hypothetical protein